MPSGVPAADPEGCPIGRDQHPVGRGQAIAAHPAPADGRQVDRRGERKQGRKDPDPARRPPPEIEARQEEHRERRIRKMLPQGGELLPPGRGHQCGQGQANEESEAGFWGGGHGDSRFARIGDCGDDGYTSTSPGRRIVRACRDRSPAPRRPGCCEIAPIPSHLAAYGAGPDRPPRDRTHAIREQAHVVSLAVDYAASTSVRP